MNSVSELVEVDEISLEGIGRFLWRVRRGVMLIVITLLLVVWGYLLLTEYRSSRDEYRAAFSELQSRNYTANTDFSSANLNRLDEGIYRLRVEVTGDHSDVRREDTPIDFDRDLEIIVQLRNGFLALNIVNKRDDVIVQDVEIRGSLINRADDDFQQIATIDIQANLGYTEASRGVPISIFKTDNYTQLRTGSWQWLTDIAEFRENFKLHYMEVTFVALAVDGGTDELIRLRYTTSTDFYEVRNREFLF